MTIKLSLKSGSSLMSATPVEIVNAQSPGGQAPITVATIDSSLRIFSGTTVAGVYKSVLSVSLPAVIDLLSIARRSVDVTSKTIGIKLVDLGPDAFEPFDASDTASITALEGIKVIDFDGSLRSNTPKAFKNGFEVFVKDSLGGSDLTVVQILYSIMDA